MPDEPEPLTASELAELRYEVQWYPADDNAFSRESVERLLATVAALQEALRAVLALDHRPDMSVMEKMESMAGLAYDALLGDTPTLLASERPCAACGHARWHHHLEDSGRCVDAGCACTAYEAGEAGRWRRARAALLDDAPAEAVDGH